MFWKKKTTIKTMLGPISLSTLKHNKMLVIKLYDEKLKEVETEEAQLLDAALKGMIQGIYAHCGYVNTKEIREHCVPTESFFAYVNQLEKENVEIDKKTMKFIKNFKLDKMCNNAMKTASDIARLKRERMLILNNRYKEVESNGN